MHFVTFVSRNRKVLITCNDLDQAKKVAELAKAENIRIHDRKPLGTCHIKVTADWWLSK